MNRMRFLELGFVVGVRTIDAQIGEPKARGLLSNQLKQNLMRFTSIDLGFLDEIQWVFEGLGQFWES